MSRRDRGLVPQGRRGGFTLIEMMAVLVVVGILLAMAVPTYLDRIVQQQILAAMPLADIATKPVAASWAVAQAFPSDNAAAGLPAADKIVNNFVAAVQLEYGVVTLTFGNRAAGAIMGRQLSLRPAIVEDAAAVPVTWVCGYAEAPEKMTVQGTNRTNIPEPYLPTSCRPFKR